MKYKGYGKIVTYRYVAGLYPVRFRMDGYNIEVASKSFDIMRQNFWTSCLRLKEQSKTQNIPYSLTLLTIG
ncbi:MAG: hypothetical protein K2N23_01285 [Clostridia bacterium]|nr:hypothetical protein [Clostridia bacterium]